MKLHIAEMLRAQSEEHLSFHTPGHKHAGADITELSYSDNLYAPHGVIAAAEADISDILGANRSFILTDGSTSGIFSMLAALKSRSVSALAYPQYSHPSVYHACELLGIRSVLIPQETEYGILRQPSARAVEAALRQADALLLTSPDYYGFFAPLAEARAICDGQGKPFVVDGAHGSHLHFSPEYAGKFADMWVDGVHKSLPALTQGAVVSATDGWVSPLSSAVRRFRTTSPSYPIMASVEYAVKYPRNFAIERAAEDFKRGHGCLGNDDWTKILVPFGAAGEAAAGALEKEGLYPEFYDGNYILFYLSPCTKESDLLRLGEALDALPRGEVASDAPTGAVPVYREGP